MFVETPSKEQEVLFKDLIGFLLIKSKKWQEINLVFIYI